MEYKQKEFCRLTNLTRKSLLLYEERGLLLPTRVDRETGYRYYGDEALERGSRIALLRALSLSLSQMEELIYDEQLFSSILAERESSLRSQLHKISLGLKFCSFAQRDGVSLQNNSFLSFFHSDQHLTREGWGGAREVGQAFDALFRYASSIGLSCADDPFTIYLSDSTKDELHFKVCCPLYGVEWFTPQARGFSLEYTLKQSVRWFRHWGAYELLPFSYEKLRARCKCMGENLTGEYVERYRVGGSSFPATDSSLFITDIGGFLC